MITMTNEEFLQRYDSGKAKFTYSELSQMAYEEFGDCIDVVEGECLRWTQCMETIFEVDGRRFAVSWDKGLTECQDNDFSCSEVYEVVKKEKITFEWVRKEDNTND